MFGLWEVPRVVKGTCCGGERQETVSDACAMHEVFDCEKRGGVRRRDALFLNACLVSAGLAALRGLRYVCSRESGSDVAGCSSCSLAVLQRLSVWLLSVFWLALCPGVCAVWFWAAVAWTQRAVRGVGGLSVFPVAVAVSQRSVRVLVASQLRDGAHSRSSQFGRHPRAQSWSGHSVEAWVFRSRILFGEMLGSCSVFHLVQPHDIQGLFSIRPKIFHPNSTSHASLSARRLRQSDGPAAA